MQLDKETLSRLGIDLEEVDLDVASRPSSATARGYTSATGAETLRPAAELANLFAANPERLLALPRVTWERPPTTSVTVLDAGESFVVESPGPVPECVGDVVEIPQQAGRLWVVPSASTSALAFATSDRILLLKVENGRIGLREIDPGAVADVPAPPVEEWLTRQPGPEWLREEARRLSASASLLDRVASAGMVNRFWYPANVDSEQGFLAVVASDEPTPPARAMQWFQQLDPKAALALERWGNDRAQNLLEELPILQERIIAAGTDLHPVLAWVHARDDLQSVRSLLMATGTGAHLDRVLNELDSVVASYHSMWSLIGPLDSARLRDLTTQDPDVWWAALVNDE